MGFLDKYNRQHTRLDINIEAFGPIWALTDHHERPDEILFCIEEIFDPAGNLCPDWAIQNITDQIDCLFHDHPLAATVEATIQSSRFLDWLEDHEALLRINMTTTTPCWIVFSKANNTPDGD